MGFMDCKALHTKARPLTAHILEHVYKNAMRDVPLAPIGVGLVVEKKHSPQSIIRGVTEFFA